MEEEETAVVQRRWDDERSRPCSCLVARDELDGNKETKVKQERRSTRRGNGKRGGRGERKVA